MTKFQRRGIAVLISGICVGASSLAMAEDRAPLPTRLSGLINDYSPASVKNGPYEIRGEWALDVYGASGKVRFSAAVNMETSDWGISEGIVDPNDPTRRGAHTHHITLADSSVSRDTSVCPALSPPTSGGFVVTGTVHVTGNGSPAPFESNGNPPTTAQICVTGGSSVDLSNFSLTFIGPATAHFGTQAINGVVTCVTGPGAGTPQGLCGEGSSQPHDGGASHSH